jgi:dTDP-4-dehydrorhamnose reductase
MVQQNTVALILLNGLLIHLKAGKKEIRIVDDQINNPTFIDDLVQGINKIVELRKEGIYNIGGNEFLSRYDFTIMIANFFNLDKSLIKQNKN